MLSTEAAYGFWVNVGAREVFDAIDHAVWSRSREGCSLTSDGYGKRMVLETKDVDVRCKWGTILQAIEPTLHGNFDRPTSSASLAVNTTVEQHIDADKVNEEGSRVEETLEQNELTEGNTNRGVPKKRRKVIPSQ